MTDPDRLGAIKARREHLPALWDNPALLGADIDWLIGEVDDLGAALQAGTQAAAAAEANLADERGREIARLQQDLAEKEAEVDDKSEVGHRVAEAWEAEATRLRDGIKAALGCHTETARRVTLQELLEPPGNDERPPPG